MSGNITFLERKAYIGRYPERLTAQQIAPEVWHIVMLSLRHDGTEPDSIDSNLFGTAQAYGCITSNQNEGPTTTGSVWKLWLRGVDRKYVLNSIGVLVEDTWLPTDTSPEFITDCFTARGEAVYFLPNNDVHNPESQLSWNALNRLTRAGLPDATVIGQYTLPSPSSLEQF